MVLVSSSWLWPVQHSCVCFLIVLACSIWQIMILFGVGCFWPALDRSGILWPYLWLGFFEFSLN